MLKLVTRFTFLLIPAAVVAALPQQEPSTSAEAQQLVEAWFTRWNALDGTPETTQAVVQLYAGDALHTAGPAVNQLGTATFHGHDGIKTMVESYVAAFEKPSYRISAVTAKEKTALLFNTAAGPWGGSSVAVEFAAVYTSRHEGKRFVCPGAAFFQLENGKIRRLRIYMATGELTEVEPEPAPRRRPPA
jgi:hypothetical protein